MRIFSASAGFIFSSLLFPFAHSALVMDSQPDSVIDKHVETFHLTCPDNPKETTIDMQGCLAEKKSEVEWVKNRYLVEIREQLNKSFDGDDAAHKARVAAAFEKENQAWDALRASASEAIFTDYEQGTIRGIMAGNREIALIEMQIHEQWQTWLTNSDSTPALLPEPLFTDPDNH